MKEEEEEGRPAGGETMRYASVLGFRCKVWTVVKAGVICACVHGNQNVPKMHRQPFLLLLVSKHSPPFWVFHTYTDAHSKLQTPDASLSLTLLPKAVREIKVGKCV